MFNALNSLVKFGKNEGGAMTALNLFFLSTVALIGGVAVDVSSVISARTQLQATADAAAHAALVEREWHSPEAAKAKAIELAKNAAGNAELSNFAVIHALPRIQDMAKEDGLFVESMMASFTATSPEAEARLQAFLDKKAKRLNIPKKD